MDDMVERVARAIKFVTHFDYERCGHDVEWVDSVVQQAARAAIEALPGWQPIETAPRDGTRIWCGWAGSDYMTYLFWSDRRAAWCAGDGGWGSDRYHGEDAPTHWMPKNPIPAPPSGG